MAFAVHHKAARFRLAAIFASAPGTRAGDEAEVLAAHIPRYTEK